MLKEDRAEVIKGLVHSNGTWISIEKKVELEKQRQRKIEAGYVRFQGEWITIEEKLRRIQPEIEKREIPQQIVIHNQDNRRVYNVHHHHNHSSQQTVHEHKHLHLDKEELREIHSEPPKGLETDTGTAFLEGDRKKNALPKGKKKPLLPGDKNKGFLPPPETP